MDSKYLGPGRPGPHPPPFFDRTRPPPPHPSLYSPCPPRPPPPPPYSHSHPHPTPPPPPHPLPRTQPPHPTPHATATGGGGLGGSAAGRMGGRMGGRGASGGRGRQVWRQGRRRRTAVVLSPIVVRRLALAAIRTVLTRVSLRRFSRPRDESGASKLSRGTGWRCLRSESLLTCRGERARASRAVWDDVGRGGGGGGGGAGGAQREICLALVRWNSYSLS